MKRSVLTIKNKDDLCCAHAIVTAKAKVDNHSRWQSFQKGAKIQYEQALLLHNEVSIPHGPCSYEELNKFSQAPSLYDYQLLLVDETRGFRVLSFGPAQDKKLVLLYDGNHYDVISSLPGYFATSYFCCDVLNLTTMRDGTRAPTIQTTALCVYKTIAEITWKPSADGNERLYYADPVNGSSMGTYVCNNI